MKNQSSFHLALAAALALSSTIVARADDDPRSQVIHPVVISQRCKDLPSHDQVQSALKAVVDVGGTNNAGFGLNMWATIVNRDGEVAAVAFSGRDRGDQWPGSRVISAQKANTANAFSLPNLALSTANLYSAVQTGDSLYGLQESNPVNATVAYGGNPGDYGTTNDPM